MFAEHEKASATIEGLSKKVNKKVMQMFDKAEQEYNELKRKKDVVENDKSRIEQVGPVFVLGVHVLVSSLSSCQSAVPSPADHWHAG